jgi:hypothetical protein
MSTYWPVKLFAPPTDNAPEGRDEVTPPLAAETVMATHEVPSMVALMVLREDDVMEMRTVAVPAFP